MHYISIREFKLRKNILVNHCLWNHFTLYHRLWSLVLSMAAVVAATPPADDGQIWAVLVAGSYEYYNYRHQVNTFV